VSLDAPVPLTRADLPASSWFVWKTRCVIAGFLLLAWAFVATVFHGAAAVAWQVAGFFFPIHR
jgi:hypothetical protein